MFSTAIRRTPFRVRENNRLIDYLLPNTPLLSLNMNQLFYHLNPK